MPWLLETVRLLLMLFLLKRFISANFIWVSGLGKEQTLGLRKTGRCFENEVEQSDRKPQKR